MLNTTPIMLMTFSYCCHNTDFLTRGEGKDTKAINIQQSKVTSDCPPYWLKKKNQSVYFLQNVLNIKIIFA